jgi:hypothetical protein
MNFTMGYTDLVHLEKLLALIEGKEMPADAADAAKSLQVWAQMQNRKREKWLAKARAENPENIGAQ